MVELIRLALASSVGLLVANFFAVPFALFFAVRYARVIRALREILQDRATSKGTGAALIEKVRLLSESSFEGETINSLMRSCHNYLGALGVELATSPELYNDRHGATSVRLTSGRPVTQNAQAVKLRLGDLTIGQLRFDAPALNRVQAILLERIVQALTIQLIAQRTSRELRQMAGVEAQGDKARTGFIASLSHELRGPLGMVLNAVELVRDELCGPINSDQRETLGLVHGNVRHLLSLVNDVLDFAKTESGNAVPNRVSIDIKTILEELVGSARGQADAKHQKLTLDTNDDLQCVCDERHLRQIILNLLTNAVKYTPEHGNISVNCKPWGARIQISVRDSGVGIPESELHKVFTPFERVSTGLSEQGTGLGMPLSKLLAEKNGGELTFTSKPGSGSEFVLIVERGSEHPVVAPDLTLNANLSLAGQSLLLASRDADQLNILSRALGALNAVVDPVTAEQWQDLEHSGAGAKKGITAVIIDSTVVSSDATSHNDIASWVEFANKRKVPLVMLTPRAFEFDTAEYIKSGVDICVAKPFQTTDLAQALVKLRTLAV